MFGSKGKKIKGDAVMLRRRDMLTAPPANVAPEGMDTNQVWLAAFELVKPEAAITYVCLADGTTHAYFSNGKGFENLEVGPSVPEAAQTFLGLTERHLQDYELTASTASPQRRQVTFWCRKGNATHSLTLMEDVVAVGGHPMTKLYQAGIAVSKHCAATI